MFRRLLACCAVLLLTAGLAACSPGEVGRPHVVASFYPLQYVAQRIVGSRLEVVGLTPPGVEPHDYELKPSEVADVSSAKVAFYLRGLQPAVDDAIAQNGPKRVLDAAAVVHLRPGEGGQDPHFWQDPTLLARAAAAFAAEMTRADPRHAAAYRHHLQGLQADLAALDRDYRRGLAHCATRTLVVSHDAFEYLGRRYGLDVHPIAGLSPDAEPSAQHLQQLSTLARDQHVTTVFNETLASPRLADTLAREVGVRTAVLDPIEALSSDQAKDDYLSLMRANLRAIRQAGSCA